MPEKKKKNKSASQKKQSQSKASPSKKQAPPPPQKPPHVRGMGMRIFPYVLCVFAFVLAVAFILVNFGGSAGDVGYFVQALFCALLGNAAYALPLLLGYIGIKWCLYNIKWNNEYLDAGNEFHEDYLKAKRRMVLQVVMTLLTLIMLSTLIGVLAEQDALDVSEFWYDGIDHIGGGVLGGVLSAILIPSVGEVISVILVCILIALFILLALGLTPDYILSKLRDRHIAKARRRAEARRVQAQTQIPRQAPTPTPVPTPAPAPEPVQKQASKKEMQSAREVTVDELLADAPTPTPAPMSKQAEEDIRTQSIPIGPSEEHSARSRKKSAEPTEEVPPTPLDFGGDPGFDTGEFDNIDNILKGFDTPIGEAPSASIEIEKNEPEDNFEPINMSEMQSDDLLEDMAAVTPDDTDDISPEIITPYVFPPIDFLTPNKNANDTTDHTEELQNNAKILVETLRSFRVGIKEVTYSRGPTITRYELKPEVGTRVRSIANLVDDIALNLATSGVRIEAPIPGKAAVGIEVPNQTRATVYLRDLIDTPKFTDSKSKLTAALGMDVGGNPIHFDIGKMPHLLIAGTTGSGKSICINCIIISILYKAKPEELKLILIDPKKVEFNMYKNIPHLYCPIVSEPKKAAGALASAVAEMERRFELIEQAGVRDIASYNAAAETDSSLEFMPHMVIIIDELADLMMTARDEVETSICRIAQKARAAGIHMILGTQRPSVDVITGLIKANVPSRIACTVMSQVDSRTIIDVAGAENLIGRGDMLFAPVGASKPMRVQGAFVSENEIEKIVSFVKENNGNAKYNTDFINRIEEEAAKCGTQKKGAGAAADIPAVEGGDSKFSEAVKMAIEEGKISTSLMQRRLGVGYGRAAKMIDTMEELGYVSKPDGNKPRRVLITMEEYARRIMDGELGDSE